MRLQSRAFGLAAGITAAVLYSLCALLVAVNPGGATALFGFVMHLDLTAVARPLTFAGFLGGVVFWGVLVGLTFAFAARLYNRLADAPAATPAPLREPELARG
jgi:hypothetical protein